MKKSKTIKHENMLQPNPGLGKEGYQYFLFVCRGCAMMNRKQLWRNFVSSMSDMLNKKIDNSYLTFEEEPENIYDQNAIMVVCRGEFFGTTGYVGREYTLQIKEILQQCVSYRIDMVDEDEVGNREISLIITWE